MPPKGPRRTDLEDDQDIRRVRGGAVQRYELKFLVDAQVKARLLQAAAPGLRDDPNGDQGVYRVTSQYFDSPQHTALTEKLDGVALRRKLRVRFYGLAPARSYHLEIKARQNNLVSKHRLPLSPATVAALLEDSAWNLPRLHQFTDLASLSVDERYLLAAIELQAAQQKLQATAVISYLREAWVGRYDDHLRVTFDHQCEAFGPADIESPGRVAGASFLAPHQFILETKFNHRIPAWLRDILALEGVMPVRFSKYAQGMLALAVPR